MIRSFVLGFLVLFSLSIGISSNDRITSSNQYSALESEQFELTVSKKNKQSKELEKKVKAIFAPAIVLKNAIEPHLPQRELKTAKRLALKLILLINHYL